MCTYFQSFPGYASRSSVGGIPSAVQRGVRHVRAGLEGRSILALQTYSTGAKPNRRFARLPHDREVERTAQEFYQDCSAYRAIELLLPEIERGAFMGHTRYNNRCCATLTRDGDDLSDACNAVAGWGKTPAYALVDLAFRWCVLMRQSWLPAQHVPLVSEVR